MRRWIGLILCVVLTNPCIGQGGEEPPHPGLLSQDRHTSGAGNKDQPLNELRTARQIAARQLIAEAWEEAQRLPTAEDKLSAYLSIAEAQARAGDGAGLRKSIDAFQAALARIDGKSGGEAIWFCQIARVQILAGDIVAARQTVEKAKATVAHDKSDGHEDRMLGHELILGVQLHLGDNAGARESVAAAKKIAGELRRTDAYCTVALMQVELKDQTAARQSVEAAKAIAAKTTVDSDYPLLEITKAQAALGAIAEAKATLAGVRKDDIAKTNAHEVIAMAQAGKGDFAGAKATIALIPKEAKGNRAVTLAKIAIAEAKGRGIAAAKATVEGVGDDCVKTVAYRRIGGLQVKCGDLSGALATAEQIRARTSTANQTADPNATECQCARESFSAMLYCQIAQAQADAEDMAAARRTLTLAQGAARRSVEAADAAAEPIKRKPDEGPRVAWLYLQSAAAQAMAGDASGAIRTISKSIGSSLFRCQELSLIAEELRITQDEESVLLRHAGF